jgi:hypothetical protein
VAAATAGGADGVGAATGAAGPAVVSAPVPGGDGEPPVPAQVRSAAVAQEQVEVAVDAAMARRYLELGYGWVSGWIAAAGTTDGAGYRVRWREADPLSGIRPGIAVRKLPLPPGALLVRAEDIGERVVASYRAEPDRWVATEPGSGQPLQG